MAITTVTNRAPSYKASSLLDEIAASLAIRLLPFGATVGLQTRSLDDAGNPCLLVGAASAGAEGCFIRLVSQPGLNCDILGLGQAVWAPLVGQIGFETEPCTVSELVTEAPLMNLKAFVVQVVSELVVRGLKVEVYEDAAGTAPCIATVGGDIGTGAGGTLITTFDSSPLYPLAGQ